MNKLKPIALIMLFSSIAANSISLQQTVKESLVINNEIKSNILGVKSKKIAIRKEKSAYYPTLDLNSYLEKSQTKDNLDNASEGDWVKKDGVNAKLNANQLLYDGGKSGSTVDSARYEYSSSQYETLNKNEAVVLDITKAYTKLVKANELDIIINESLETHNNSFDIAKEKEEIAGEEIETKKVESMLSTAYDKKYIQEEENTQALANFNRLTLNKNNVDLCRPSIDESLIPASLDQAIDLALANSYRIKAQNEKIKYSKSVTKQSRSNYKPEVNLKLSAGYDDDLELIERGSQKELLGQVALDWNFYSGGRDSSAVEESKINSLQENEILSDVKNKVIESVTNSYNQFYRTKDRIKNFQSAILSNISVLDLTTQQLEDGTKTFIEVLVADVKVTDSKTNLINQEIQLIDSYYTLMNDFSLLSQTVLNSNMSECAAVQKTVTPETKLVSEENNNSELLIDDENSTLAQQVKNILSNDITYKEDEILIDLGISAESFTIKEVNSNNQLKTVLDSFSKEILDIIAEHKEEIAEVAIVSHASSEWRSTSVPPNANIPINKDKNLALSQRRANKVKNYFMNQVKENGHDQNYFNNIMTSTGAGSSSPVVDEYGIENNELSRRVTLQIKRK